MRNRNTLSILLLVACGTLAVAQAPEAPTVTGIVSPSTFANIVYPPVARLGRVEGAVTVTVVIDERGLVNSATATSGPVVLTAAASDNAKRWTFPAGSKRTVGVVYLFEIEGYCAQEIAPTLARVLPPFNVVKVTTCHDWRP